MNNLKIKAKLKNGVVYAKAQIKHEMTSYNVAKKRGVSANFITYIVAEVDERTVFELSCSQFLSRNPIVKFKFLAKKGEVLTLTWRDLSGKSASESIKIK